MVLCAITFNASSLLGKEFILRLPMTMFFGYFSLSSFKTPISPDFMSPTGVCTADSVDMLQSTTGPKFGVHKAALYSSRNDAFDGSKVIHNVS